MGHDQAAVRRVGEGRDGVFDLAGIAYIDRVYLYLQRLRRGPNGDELGNSSRVGSIPQDGCSPHARRDLLEKLQPFSAQPVLESHEAGSVATRPGQRID